MTDPVFSDGPDDEELPSGIEAALARGGTIVQLQDALDPNSCPYALIDELGIPRDHPLVLLSERLNKRWKKERQVIQEQPDEKK